MPKPETPDFNLIDDPWIPVVRDDGSSEVLSIGQTFVEAPRISRVVGDIPQQSALMLRVMEAILYRAYFCAYGDVWNHTKMLELWINIWEAESFDQEVLAKYFAKHHERFSLFGETPFMQVPGLIYDSKDKEFDRVSEMVMDVPKPDKFLFSMRASSASNRLSFGESARWLLCAQYYGCSGIKTPVVGNTHVNKGKVYPPKGLPGIGWSGSIGTVYVEGKSLFETLMLNFVMFDEDPRHGDCFGIQEDMPSWEKDIPPVDDATFAPAGPASLFTVLDRRMRLVADEKDAVVVGVVECYGDIVRPTETSRSETMTAWRESEQQQKKLGLAEPPLMPKTHDCSKALWRGLGPLLAPAQEPGKPDLRPGVIRWVELLREEEVERLPRTLRIHAQGAEYGSQSSVITNMYDDALDLGDAMIRRDPVAVRCAIDTVAQIDEAVSRLVYLVKDLQDLSGSKREGDPAKREGADVREQAYLALDTVARGYLRDFTEERSPIEYCREWRKESRSILLRLGRDYISGSEVSNFACTFTGKDVKSVAGAWSSFTYWLNKTLDLEDFK